MKLIGRAVVVGTQARLTAGASVVKLPCRSSAQQDQEEVRDDVQPQVDRRNQQRYSFARRGCRGRQPRSPCVLSQPRIAEDVFGDHDAADEPLDVQREHLDGWAPSAFRKAWLVTNDHAR